MMRRIRRGQPFDHPHLPFFLSSLFQYIDSVGDLAKKYKLKLHIDGARLMNACVATGVDAGRMVAAADSVSLCLSKGLGAPVGSVLVGTSEFIKKARRLRKALGGGMRQVGIIAAAGIIAVTEMVNGLARDHQHAKFIVQQLAAVPGFILPSIESVETNIVYVGIDSSKLSLTAAQLVDRLRQFGILSAATDRLTVRFVFHHQVSKEDVEFAIDCIKKATEESNGTSQ